MSIDAAAERNGDDIASAGAAPVVRFEAVSLNGRDDTPGLRKLSFALAMGSFHVLTGAAGSGKTSILNLICLAERPLAGRVQLFGRDTATLSRKDVRVIRRRVGLVFAEDRLLGHLPVFENAALVPRVVGRRREDYGPEVAQVLAWVGLGKMMDALPADLSAGQRRRLSIARAVAGRPDILLADEPTGGLDGETGLEVLRLLAELHGAGTTVLMASRNEELAATSGAPVLHLHEGRLAVIDGFDPASAS